MFLHEEEAVLMYRPGGLHPVCLGDTFDDGRYRVVHKLGFGDSSTVWLVRDTQDDIWAALKILTAQSSSATDNPRNELIILQALQDGDNDFVPWLHKAFLHHGPNGSHLCIVTDFLGPSLRQIVTSYYNWGERLEPDNILWLTSQLLEATALLHEAGIAHGDLSASNVVFTAYNLASLSVQALLDVMGSPETAELLNADGSDLGPHLPRQLVGMTQWSDWTDEFDEDLCLVDFGQSFCHDAVPTALSQPYDLRVPETLLAPQFDYRVDLWRLGCIIYALVFLGYPFMTLGKKTSLVRQMINFVGPLPPEWEEAWQTLIAADPSYSPLLGLDPLFADMFKDRVSERELAPLLPIIQGLMRFRPADRISARAALDLLPDESSDGEDTSKLSVTTSYTPKL